jgi:hypothetical protein
VHTTGIEEVDSFCPSRVVFVGHSGVMRQLRYVQTSMMPSVSVGVIHVSEIMQSPLRRGGQFGIAGPACHILLFKAKFFRKCFEIPFRLVKEASSDCPCEAVKPAGIS